MAKVTVNVKPKQIMDAVMKLPLDTQLKLLRKLKKDIQPYLKKINKGKRKVGIVDELLGKYKGVIPSGKSSTKFVREIREGRYGK